MKIVQYQVDAVLDLVKHTKNLLEANITFPSLVFKAPTGAGKTFICSDFIKKITNDPAVENDFSFIWIAPNKLEDQSYKSLKKYFISSNEIKCSKKEDIIINKQIKKNEILFVNWQSINQVQNRFRKAGEYDPNLNQIIFNTKKFNRKILLFIDEIHDTAGSNISKEIIEQIIKPDLIIGVSATPSIKGDEEVLVAPYKVRAAGMIKEFATINPGYRNEFSNNVLVSGLGGKSDRKVIEESLKKRDQIKKSYKKIGKKINPLIIIQIPNSKIKETINKEIIENELKSFKITTENGKLAKMLSNDQNGYSENIKVDLENKVEVLICKQAINIGWDCPRAQILVALRNWGSETFKTQTVGRIMRMPEQVHYSEKILNRSYIFTNLTQISIDRNNIENIRLKHSSLNNADAKKIVLNSTYQIKNNERIYVNFKELYQLFSHMINNDKINFDPNPLKTESIENKIILDKSPDDKINIEANKFDTILDIENYNIVFKKFIISKINNKFYADHFINILKKIFYKYFEKYDEIKTINIICDANNKSYISEVIDNTIFKYLEKYSKIFEKKFKINKNWQFETECSYSDNYLLDPNIKKNIYDRYYYLNDQSDQEKNFIKKLENSPKIVWWHKNGDSGSNNFAISYTHNKKEKLFYIDFIVKFIDESIGFYDTKFGFTIDQPDVPKKNDALLSFVKSKKNYIGGIIKNKSNKFPDHEWRIFSGKGENISNSQDLGWKSINF